MVFTNVGMNRYCQTYQIESVSHMKEGGGHDSTKSDMPKESHSGLLVHIDLVLEIYLKFDFYTPATNFSGAEHILFFS